MNKIKVIVVDDSALMRKIISDMVNYDTNIEVVAVAKNGEDLIDKLQTVSPDVITLDIEMPIMDGITTLRELKSRKIQAPVIMLSGASTKSTQLTMECLEAGVFDFIRKPGGSISLDIGKVKDELIQKIKAAANSSEKCSKAFSDNSLYTKDRISIVDNKMSFSNGVDAIVLGASTGGPKALYSVITEFPENIDVPILVVQHMPTGFTKAFADRLNANSKLRVVEATNEEVITKNTVYIAPGGFHMEIENDNKIHLNKEPQIWGVRPAVDKLFFSASKVYGSSLVSAVLTGMGRDGADGTAFIKDNGGFTISESEETCTIYGMPKATYETGKVDMVLPLYEITSQIVRLIKKTWR